MEQAGTEGQDGERLETWRITYRHSAGRLGRHARLALREEGCLLGWQTDDGTVLYPPRDLGGEGAWVDIGPGAVLLSPLSAPTGDTTLARVRPDGATCGIFAQVAARGTLPKGTRLRARVADGCLTFHPDTAP